MVILPPSNIYFCFNSGSSGQCQYHSIQNALYRNVSFFKTYYFESITSTFPALSLGISVQYISPQTPILYSETGVCTGILYLFFLFLLQKIDCRYSLESPRRSGSKVYPQSMF